MKKIIKRIFIILVLIFGVIFILNVIGGEKSDGPVVPQPPGSLILGSTKFGTYFAPRNFPTSFLTMQQDLIDQYFKDASEIGDHTSFLMRWDEPELLDLTKKIFDQAKKKGLKIHIHIDPLTGWTHAKAAPPAPLKGRHFSDPEVRQAFIKAVLDFAALKPDVLGIGTEVNLMLHENNDQEFADYVSLSKEAYAAIKKTYPKQLVTLSFSWDVMRKDKNYNILQQFKNSADVLSFTTYPNILTAPSVSRLPKNFFGDIRQHLPNERIAISELGWFSGENGSEETQAEFYEALPELLKDVKPEFVTQFVTYDFSKSFLNDEKFRTLGLRNEDGTVKKAWETVRDFKWK